MDADDPGGFRGDERLDLAGIECVRLRVDVAEDRRDLLPFQRVRGRDERERWHDHLAAQTRRADGDLQAHGAVTHGDAVAHALSLRHPSLELLDQRPIVGEPAPIEHFVDPGEQALAIGDVGPAHVECLGEGRGSSEDREVLEAALHERPPSRSRLGI